MKSIKRRMIAVITIAVMAAAILMPMAKLVPASSTYANAEVNYETPEGYNDNDYQKLVAFLETETSQGISNGEILNPGVYDPENPETWLHVDTYDWGTMDWGVYWDQVGGEMRVVSFYNNYLPLEGSIDCSEFDALTSFSMMNANVPNIDLSFCTSLYYVQALYSHVQSINLTDCYALVNLDIFDNELTSEGLEGLNSCLALEVLNISNNVGIDELDISAIESKLTILNINGTSLGDDDIDFTRLESIQEINICGTGITKVDARNCTSLTALTCRDMPLDYIYLPTGDLNMSVDCSNTGITELDVTGCYGIWQLVCSDNPITELDFSNSPWLQFIIANDCELETLNLDGCTELMVVECRNNHLTELNVAEAGQLSQIYCSGNMISEIYWHVNNMWSDEYVVSLQAEGDGYVAIDFQLNEETWEAINYFEATPAENATFVCWLDADGNEVSTDSIYYYNMGVGYDLYAVFESTNVEPTEAPVEPIETPVEPTEAPVEPVNPDVPETGTISFIGLGIVSLLASGIAVVSRKQK